MKIETEEWVLRVNKSKVSGENKFNGYHFVTEGNHGSSKDKKVLFWVVLSICDQCFKP